MEVARCSPCGLGLSVESCQLLPLPDWTSPDLGWRARRLADYRGRISVARERSGTDEFVFTPQLLDNAVCADRPEAGLTVDILAKCDAVTTGPCQRRRRGFDVRRKVLCFTA